MSSDDRTAERPGLIRYPHPNDGEPPPRPPPQYSRGLHIQICEYIRAGHHPETAAEMCGLSAGKYKAWVQRGNEGDPFLAEFARDVANAGAHAEADIASSVFEAAKKDAAIGIKWLERQRQARWNKPQLVAIESMMKGWLDTLERGLSEAEFVKVCRLLAGGQAGGGTPSEKD